MGCPPETPRWSRVQEGDRRHWGTATSAFSATRLSPARALLTLPDAAQKSWNLVESAKLARNFQKYMTLTISHQEMVALGTCAALVNNAHRWEHVLFLI